MSIKKIEIDTSRHLTCEFIPLKNNIKNYMENISLSTFLLYMS